MVEIIQIESRAHVKQLLKNTSMDGERIAKISENYYLGLLEEREKENLSKANPSIRQTIK
jgi:hypothetical protein